MIGFELKRLVGLNFERKILISSQFCVSLSVPDWFQYA